MDGRKLQDRLHRGLGTAARRIGHSADAFRPSGTSNPLSKGNHFLRLHAAFIPARGGTNYTNLYGDPFWIGVFDASYTRPGDYLDHEATIFFIASQKPMLPVLCVETNAVLSISRPLIQLNAASNPYGGYTLGGSTILVDHWPASVLSETKAGASTSNLPTDQAAPYWNILLPAIDHTLLVPGDIISDNLDRTGVIVSSELTDLGWRLSAKMATA